MEVTKLSATLFSPAVTARLIGIRGRLVLLVLVAALPLLTLIGLDAKREIAHERAVALERLQARAHSIAARLDDQLGNIDTLLIGLSHLVSANPDNIAQNEEIFRSIARDLPPYYLNVKAQSLDGGALGSTSGNRDVTVADRDYFRAAIERRGLVVDQPLVSRTKGRWSLTLARTLFDPAGEVAGMVGVSFDLAKLETLLEGEALGETALITVINEKHLILARSTDAAQWIGQASPDNPMLGRAMVDREGAVEFTSRDGTKFLAGFSTCSRAPWLVFAQLPSATALASLEQKFRRALLLIAIALALTLALAWFIGGRIVRPLRHLAADAATLGAGGELRPNNVAYSGEIGQLARSFNQMLATLAQRDAALRRSEAQFRTLIENSGDGIFITDPEGVYVEVNASGERMIGWKREELVGQQIAAILAPEEQVRIAPELARLMTGETVVSEWQLQRKDGSTFPGEISSKRLPDGRLLGVLRDIAGRKRAAADQEQLERKLQDTQKLESLGVLAGGIAHDFSNLLTGILGNASLAAMELPVGSPVQAYIDQISKASLRAADLCKQMLAYSGKGRFVVQRLQLNKLVEETTQLLQLSISKQAVLRFNLYPTLPVIEADGTQIRQVVMNLVINASEAIGSKSGVISVTTGLTRVDRTYLGGTLLAPELPEGTYVHLEVSDSGTGMTPETQAKIFEPFFTTKFTGRGLGLAAVLGIVRGHKGAIKIYSEPGRGTTFKLLFPCATGDEELGAADGIAKDLWRGHGCVLVVDDDESVRSTASAMLRKLGFEAALARDGREAVSAFRAEPDRFALVLMDLTMPHLDGEQAFAELRRIRPNARVVLMSGFNQHEAVSRFTGKGLASFLQKPFQVESLSATLQGALAGTPNSDR